MDIFDEIHAEHEKDFRHTPRGQAHRPVSRANLPNPASAPTGVKKVIDKSSALAFYDFADLNPEKARALAVQHGWKLKA